MAHLARRALDRLLDSGQIDIETDKLSASKLEQLRAHPNLIEALDDWLWTEGLNGMRELRELADLIMKLYHYRKPMMIYRGIEPTDSQQDTLGLSHTNVLGHHVKVYQAGHTFQVPHRSTRIVFTRRLEIAKSFGKTIIACEVNPKIDSILVVTDELAALVSERRNFKPVTRKEVILLPPLHVTFTVTEK